MRNLFFLAFFLVGCSLNSQSNPALTVLPPAASPSPILRMYSSASITPRAATATAVEFQLKATSTLIPTATAFSVTPMSFNSFGPDNFPPEIDPLTGLRATDPALLSRRPIVIKVTNFPRSVRPQWGLSLADHVYEYYIGDQMTRFIGLFYGDDASRAGPIRSGRFFDEHIVRMYKAIFVFGSADPRVLDPWLESDLRNFLVIERAGNCPPLCRIGPESAYNTLFADTSKMSSYLAERRTNNDRQDLNGFRFDQSMPGKGQPGKRISTYYTLISYNYWEYDPVTSRYVRFQESQDESLGQKAYQPLSDSQSGAQLAADNVIVLLIPHEYFVNTPTTEMVKINFDGQGGAYAYRDGRVYSIQWRRQAQDKLFTLESGDGHPYPLKPGRIWFQVIGVTSQVNQPAEGSWEFTFAIP